MSEQKQPKKLKVQLSFEPSLDVVSIANSGSLGEAGYLVTLYLDRAAEPQQMRLPPQATSFDIVVLEEQDIVATVAALDRNGIASLATIVRMKVPPVVPPARPQNLRITRVMPALDVIQDPGVTQNKPTHNENDRYFLTITGHGQLKDGAVGVVTAVESTAVLVKFPDNAFLHGQQPDVIRVPQNFAGKATIISPSQETMTLGEYIEVVNCSKAA